VRGFGIGSGFGSGVASGFGSGSSSGLDSGLVPDPIPGLDPDFVLDSDFKPLFSLGKTGDASGLNQEHLPELSMFHGSGADAGNYVDISIGVADDCSAQGTASSRSLELSMETSPMLPERSPECSMIHDSGVDASTFVDASIGVEDDCSAQGERPNGELQVRFPDFPLPWEDALSVSSGGESDSRVPVAVAVAGEETINPVAMVSPPVKSLFKRGFFGPRAAASSTAVVESLPALACEVIHRDTLSVGMADLDRGPSNPVPSTTGISKSELGYFRRVKEKVAKQLSKNKELLVEDLDEGAEEPSKEVLRTLKVAFVVGMAWGGDDKKMLDLLLARERKTKGLRELKNLDCSVSPVKSQCRQGRNGSKNAITFPPKVH
jgi:hypothetical protein